MPAGSEPRRGPRGAAAHLAAARRPARRLVLRRRCCWSCASRPGSTFDAEVRARFTLFQRLTLVVLGAAGLRRVVYALVRSRVVGRARAAGRGQRLPAPRARLGRRSSRCSLPAGRPVGHPRPRRRHHGRRRWASRAPTAPGRAPRVRELRALLDRVTRPVRPAGLTRPRGCPSDARARRRARPAGASMTRSVPLRKASGGAVIGSTASERRAVAGRVVAACRPAASGARSSTHRATPRPVAGSRSTDVARPSASRTRSVKAWSSTRRRSAGAPGSRTSCRSTGLAPVGSLRSSMSSRVAAGRVSSRSSTGPRRRQVGVRPDGVRRGRGGQVGRRLGDREPVGATGRRARAGRASTGSRSAPSAGRTSETELPVLLLERSRRPSAPGRARRWCGPARSAGAGGTRPPKS